MSLIHLPLYEWLANVAEGALSSRETVRASFDFARLAMERGVEGDFVECGVYGGAQCAAMARAVMLSENYSDKRRKVHLFDSFTGVPKPGPEDEGWSHPEGVSLCSLEACKEHMTEWGIPESMLVWHPGPFDKTMDGSGIEQLNIAVLRLDADLYESTLCAMHSLYPLVSPGGWVIVDDFALPGCRKAVLEVVSPAPIYFQKGVL